MTGDEILFINIDSRIVEVNVLVKPSNRGTYLRVKNDKVHITSYRKLKDEEISQFVLSYKDKILDILLNNDKRADIIHYLGNEYNLKMIIGSNKPKIIGNEITIYVQSFNDFDIKKKINEIYFFTLLDIIKESHLEYEKEFNVNENINYEIKDVKTYFGKCYYKENRIVLAAKLAKYDKELILSVLAHELTHFHVFDHSKRFYNYIEKRIPNYSYLQKKIRSIKYNDKY